MFISQKNIFQNGINTFLRMINQNSKFWAWGPNTYQIMCGETLDFQCQSTIKFSIGKWIFAVNLSLKLFRATAAIADTGSLKYLYTLFDTYLNYMLAKLESNYMVQIKTFSVLTKSQVFNETFRQNVAAILQDVHAAQTIIFSKNFNLRLLSFSISKIMVVRQLQPGNLHQTWQARSV